MTTDPAEMGRRKRRHIDVCLHGDVNFAGVTTGLERYRLPFNALTQTSLHDIDMSADFFGARLRAPILIGAMTGGPNCRRQSTAIWRPPRSGLVWG
ncbi:isopentenyl-diphosphate delta-isomerase domain protein [Mycobacterium kansasii 732]|nr:isopentenyl-diphosphate delta-isomerase domain protein [Mycobacterium kansasii 732]